MFRKKTYFSESSVHFGRTFLVPQTDRVNQPEEVVPFRPKIDKKTKYLVINFNENLALEMILLWYLLKFRKYYQLKSLLRL